LFANDHQIVANASVMCCEHPAYVVSTYSSRYDDVLWSVSIVLLLVHRVS